MLDARYAAGLFDGEGFVRISKLKRSDKHTRMCVYLGIGMTHLPTIQALQRTFGGSLHCNDHSRRNPDHRPQHFWVVTSAAAALFLKAVSPHLITKRDEVVLALKFQKSVELWRHKLGNRGAHSATRNRVMAYREELARRISELKHRRFDPQ